ncbi:signal peptidase I [Arcanobacterium canis]|uniref:Signal peptidase I n=1 Tax=Arcanobacterium canis TaxID=999183 RepID=A0ABY8FWH0_9ACTO|nr:signal peptidase I [Arcanobacterium canis]WFM82869.1 signal peptidase I [Arcanobacterium canis]
MTESEAMPPSYPPPSKEEKAVESKKSMIAATVSFFLEFFTVLAIALLIAAVVKTYLLQAFEIPSESMENTLVPGDRIVVNKLAHDAASLHRGDVIVFVDPGGWLPDKPQYEQNPVSKAITSFGQAVGLLPQNVGDHLVKRVIGLPGDKVECCTADGKVTVNGKPITETYLKPGVKPSDEKFSVTVPQNHLWVMGDNRNRSADSRFHQNQSGFGFVPMDNVEGRAWLTIYPFNRFGRLSDHGSVFDGVPHP